MDKCIMYGLHWGIERFFKLILCRAYKFVVDHLKWSILSPSSHVFCCIRYLWHHCVILVYLLSWFENVSHINFIWHSLHPKMCCQTGIYLIYQNINLLENFFFARFNISTNVFSICQKTLSFWHG